MIEATCAACGNINRVAEGELASGAKFVICGSCKARVPLPARAKGAEIADLPSPKRASPLGGAEVTGKPLPRSGLAAALDAELPAPRATPPASSSKVPGPLELDELLAPPGAPLGIADLPMPKGAARPPAIPDRPALADLPMPKGKPAVPKIDKQPTADLPAPKPKIPAISKPPPPPLDLDLPTIKVPTGIVDLPGVREPLPDLPAPKVGGVIDLPAPRPAGDLPSPKAARPAKPDERPPVPKGGKGDLAPKGFFDDLPRPSSAIAKPELPAPKGFFDDLPQPAPASSQKGASELPAPKGFFDDLPGHVNQHAKAERADKPEVPAPKGFFDDLPQPAATKPAQPEVPAPKGFFDDLPGRVNATKPEVATVPAPKGFFDDLPQPSRAKPITSTPIDLDLEPSEATVKQASPPVEEPSSSFDDLDLSKPSAVSARSVEAAKRQVAPAAPADRDSLSVATFRPAEAGASLELEEPRHQETPKLAPKRQKVSEPVDPATARKRARRMRIVLAGVLVVGALGAGGFLLYRRHAASVARAEAIEAELVVARTALSAKDAAHYQRAATAANKVVALDPKHPQAIGIAAEALFAQGLSDGKNAKGKFGQARLILSKAADAGLSGPEIVRASALQAIVANQPDVALAKLKPLVGAAPKDPTLALYLGWASALKGDQPGAIAAFELALTSEAHKLPALYGRGLAKLAQGEQAAAITDFEAVLAIDNTHLGAQVGLDAALPASKAQQQEAELLALLQRKDIATGDPRAVLQAWTLLADGARRGNRLDVARERYRKALELVPLDVGAMTGLAETELRDGKLDAAAELLKKALDLSKDHVGAQLAQSELSLARKDLADAGARLDVLAARTPPLPTFDQARVKLLQGRLLDAKGEDKSLELYLEAAKLAGDRDLTPTLAAAGKLAQLADTATKAKDTAKATAYRAQADQLLATLAANAEKDPQLALTLGTAYLQTGQAASAEPWLRKAVVAHPDAESNFQLAKALAVLGNTEDAIVGLKTARGLAPERLEIALELARTYELAGKDAEAEPLYLKLVEAAEPSLEARARAGRFFARRGDAKRAGEQADKILAADSQHPTGLYLKGEAMIADGQLDEARKLLQQAVALDRDPQYLDAQGRANELLSAKTGDGKLQDAALIAYMAAAEAAPTMFNPFAGQGRLYINRREFAKAVPPLLVASKLRADDGEVSYLIGLAYKELQQTAAAIEWLKRAAAQKPSAEASWNLGQLYLDANRGRDAAGALTTATRLALENEKQSGKQIPWLTEALHKLGRANLDLGNQAGAREAFRLYLGRNPNPGPQRQEAERALLRLGP